MLRDIYIPDIKTFRKLIKQIFI